MDKIKTWGQMNQISTHEEQTAPHYETMFDNVGIKGFPGRNVPAAKSYIKWDLTWCVSPTLHHSNTACKSEILSPHVVIS